MSRFTAGVPSQEIDIAIEVENVTLEYRTRQVQSLRGAWRTWGRRSTATRRTITALADVTLSVPRGRTLGVLGTNGAGKSSLLRVMAGVLAPSAGRVAVTGDVGTLLSLGIGFRPHLTGRENVLLSGLAAGQSRDQIEEQMAEIVSFSELEEFIDIPVSAYSSGMSARLAFAAATTITPEILLVDEALSAGDARFKKKARERMEELIRSSGTVVLVSHSLDALETMCDQAVWLDRGQLVLDGSPTDVVTQYLEHQQVSRLEERDGNL